MWIDICIVERINKKNYEKINLNEKLNYLILLNLLWFNLYSFAYNYQKQLKFSF